MDRQGFDPMEKTPGEVIAFMENIEAAEDRPDASKKSNTTDKKETKKPKKSGNSNGGNTKYYRAEHGENWIHDAKDCRALQNKAKSNNNNGRFQNKTWNCKMEEAKKEATKELATLIAKQVKKGVKKQLAATDKKQKNDDDSDSDKDCAPLQGLTGALDGFQLRADGEPLH